MHIAHRINHISFSVLIMFSIRSATTQTYIVAPGNDIDILTLTGTQISKFYEGFDTVRVINTANTVGFRFKGPQPAYPDCASYFMSTPVEAKTDGFMICHPQKTKHIEMKPGNGDLESLWQDMGGRIQPISYVQVGKRVTSFLDFERNPGMERISMEAGTTHDLIKECKPRDAGAPVPELRPKFLKVTTTDPNIKGTTSSRRYNTALLNKGGGGAAATSQVAESTVEEEEEEAVSSNTVNDASSFRSQSSTLKSLDDLDPVASHPAPKKTGKEEEEDEDADIFDSSSTSSSMSSSTSSSASQMSLSAAASSTPAGAPGSKGKRQTDDDEQG